MILIIEDNDVVREGLIFSLKQNNYEVLEAKNRKEAETIILEKSIELIILDISLPDGNGINIYEKIIKEKEIPTIFLTANEDEEVIVKCLNLGAEEYITKPFRTKELLARINRIISKINKNTIIKVKDITFDIDKMEAYKNKQKIDLTSLELKILHLLFTNINKVVTRSFIIEKIWEWTGNDVEDNTVTVYLKRIREKLKTDIIITIKGIGYRIDNEK